MNCFYIDDIDCCILYIYLIVHSMYVFTFVLYIIKEFCIYNAKNNNKCNVLYNEL